MVQVCQGVQELHKIGYVHRDLKPENVVVSFMPLQVKIIDFNRALPAETDTTGTVKGTFGYFPEREDWRDGSTKWDVWAIAVMMMELDLEHDTYQAKTEDEIVGWAEWHIGAKDVCPKLQTLLKLVIVP